MRSHYALCPVSEIVGEPHSFTLGTGVTVAWDVMGDQGHETEVCAQCAEPLEGESK